MKNPEISIIIVVKNDKGIANTLAGLRCQKTNISTETIVVDASDPLLLADIRNTYSDVRWFQFIPSKPNKTTIPEQRNFGIEQAQGQIIAFIDANCVPSENWLSYLTQPILNGSEVITAGKVLASNPKTQVNYHPTQVIGDYVTSAGTGNLAFKKSLWSKIGGFDESFLFSEDTDFTWRSVEAGNKIRYIPEASMTHDWGDSKCQIKRSYNYGKGRARLFKKHQNRVKELLTDNLYVSFYTLYILGLPLVSYVWWYPFIITLVFIKNFGNKPFRTVILNISYTLGFHIELFHAICFKLSTLILKTMQKINLNFALKSTID